MDIKKYEVFLNTVDRGSFNLVCEEMGYTQSGISKMMNSMEREIGFPLLTRSNKGIQLTPEGESVIPLIRKLVRANEELNQEFQAIGGVETGKVRVGSFPTTGFIWMPEVLRVFHEEHPGIVVETVEENSIRQLEQWLNQNISDVCLFSRQNYHTYDWISLRKDPFCALLPKDHPLAGCEAVKVAELMKERPIMFKNNESLDQDVTRVFRKAGISLDPVFTSNSDHTVIRMVEQNGMVTVMPELIAGYAEEHFDVVCRPIDVKFHRELGLAVRSAEDMSPAVRKFVQCFQKVISGYKVSR